ncbi:hypothetical protein C9374_013590 [Naegleria lovaniensis]|uniref:Uncharacterized protein n=1 Tax=Naegleria lovaniensis TaxID=51637 RepID=A0AA88GW97_NAELO|nr:uncharacterized protein C9374_013590 [Naegleria lovaniensis]KAG2392105.1 hypothetical protein C9374_013590 [Naegleria lovaniensis]
MKKHNDIMKEKLQLNRDYYDIVVRLRSDVFFENRVDLLNFKVDENTLYTPLIYNWGGVNDQVSFGSVKVMDSMSQLFFEIEKIKDDTKAMFHPETFLHKLIVQRQHKIENVPISYRLIRNLQFESPSDDVREPFDEYDYS